MKKWLFILCMVMVVTACSPAENNAKEPMNHENMGHENNTEEQSSTGSNADMNAEAAFTKNTTRLIADSVMDLAIQVSQSIWPATMDNNRPNAVILVNEEDWGTALAATSLIHHPTDGPILYVTEDSVPDQTLQELERLNPKGINQAEGVQVILVGSMAEQGMNQLGDYKVTTIQAESPEEAAQRVDEYYRNLSGGFPSSVVIGSLDHPAITIPSGNWIAHMPEPLLYVQANEIPEATKNALEKRNGNAKMYLMGTEAVISKEVEEGLRQYGQIIRIEAGTAEEISIQFAQYKDEENGFGWGITEPGHGLLFVSEGQIENVIPAVAFAHRGKHAPMLVIEKSDSLSEKMMNYLHELKPFFEEEPTEGPYNHAFLIGSTKNIPFHVQGMIDDILEIESAQGMGHGGH